MADITMTYSSMEEAAKSFEQAKQEIDAAAERLTKAVNTLGGSYSGKSYNALNQAWQESQPTLKKLSEAIEAFAPELRKSAEKQREIELGQAKKNQTLGF